MNSRRSIAASSWRSPGDSCSALTAVTALVALVPTLFAGPIDRPGTPPEEIALTTGWFVALGADLLILAGSIRRSQESGARRKPPGVL